ncbi:MAG: sulfatase-like hydrolase/transferase [Clostridia bacterium]|nr:sulfatase-like hydrolase/transferase [Clostridia bacterium]
MGKPNILFIMADQFRADALHCNGGPGLTPNLDALAAEGVLFTNCYTAAPLCVPARISLFTGKYPHTTTAWDNTVYVLDPDADLWSKEIRNQGYDTAVIGKLHLHADRGNMIGMESYVNGYGFDFVNEISGPHAQCKTRTYMGEEWKAKGLFDAYCEDMAARGKTPHAKPSPLPLQDYYDTYVGRHGAEWLQNYSGNKPWFCHVSFGGPHEPWDAPEPYASMYKPEDMPPALPDVHEHGERPRGEYDKRYNMPKIHCSPEQAKEIRANYAGSVTLIDEWIGRLIDTIKVRGEWENTVVLFTSDHGELNGDHGFVNKRNFFRGAVNIPLIIRTPETARSGGHVSDALVSLIDVGPTLAEYAGKVLEYTQFGRSLCPLLAGETTVHRTQVLSELSGERMIADHEWKAVFNSQGELYLLFHLTEDPDEVENLAVDPAYREVAREMEHRLFIETALSECYKPSLTQTRMESFD